MDVPERIVFACSALSFYRRADPFRGADFHGAEESGVWERFVAEKFLCGARLDAGIVAETRPEMFGNRREFVETGHAVDQRVGDFDC